jgi:hypothetical protein
MLSVSDLQRACYCTDPLELERLWWQELALHKPRPLSWSWLVRNLCRCSLETVQRWSEMHSLWHKKKLLPSFSLMSWMLWAPREGAEKTRREKFIELCLSCSTSLMVSLRMTESRSLQLPIDQISLTQPCWGQVDWIGRLSCLCPTRKQGAESCRSIQERWMWTRMM